MSGRFRMGADLGRGVRRGERGRERLAGAIGGGPMVGELARGAGRAPIGELGVRGERGREVGMERPPLAGKEVGDDGLAKEDVAKCNHRRVAGDHREVAADRLVDGGVDLHRGQPGRRDKEPVVDLATGDRQRSNHRHDPRREVVRARREHLLQRRREPGRRAAEGIAAARIAGAGIAGAGGRELLDEQRVAARSTGDLGDPVGGRW